jgi:hypothetical protein
MEKLLPFPEERIYTVGRGPHFILITLFWLQPPLPSILGYTQMQWPLSILFGLRTEPFHSLPLLGHIFGTSFSDVVPFNITWRFKYIFHFTFRTKTCVVSLDTMTTFAIAFQCKNCFLSPRREYIVRGPRFILMLYFLAPTPHPRGYTPIQWPLSFPLSWASSLCERGRGCLHCTVGAKTRRLQKAWRSSIIFPLRPFPLILSFKGVAEVGNGATKGGGGGEYREALYLRTLHHSCASACLSYTAFSLSFCLSIFLPLSTSLFSSSFSILSSLLFLIPNLSSLPHLSSLHFLFFPSNIFFSSSLLIFLFFPLSSLLVLFLSSNFFPIPLHVLISLPSSSSLLIISSFNIPHF